MARIEGVDLPRNKRVEIALSYLFGIGPTRSRVILSATKVNPDIRVKDLTESEVNQLRDFISKNYKVEGDLRREVQMNIKRLIEIGCYRGLRPSQPAGAWTTYTHQLAHTQGSEEDRCWSRSPPRGCKEITCGSVVSSRSWGPSSPRLYGWNRP
jgi:small subunit ribosomal protein S13